MICAGRLYGLRDPNGVRPLVLGEMAQGFVIASETCALDALGARYVREIARGELCEIGPEGVRAQELLTPTLPAPCVFELVYFARPDSSVFGQSVHHARTQMGVELAKQDELQPLAVRPDVVVPIPDSGFPAAIGYARQSGVQLEKAIIRSHYIGRTFILPDQDSRTHSLRLKLSVIRSAVAGKAVLLVDDSIVRGNTSRIIVDMVREAGARKVYMRIASPPLSWPCYLGIDTPSREELIVNQHESVTAVAQSIGVDDLRYLSLDALRASTARESFCFGCMTGEYPV
jgi:amidophosphoribosyltransferase